MVWAAESTGWYALITLTPGVADLEQLIDRLGGMSINLSARPYQGGIFRLRNDACKWRDIVRAP